MQFALGIGGIASFALGSFCAFLAFEWPSFLKQLVLGYLGLPCVAARPGIGALPAGTRQPDFPGDVTRFRILPMTTHAARYWSRRLALIVGWFAFGWVTVMVLAQFGFSKEALQLFAYVLGLVLLGLGIEAIWRAPRAASGEAIEPAEEKQRRRARAVGLSLYFALLWLLWVAGAWATFWAAVILVALPASVMLTDRAVGHLLRPPGHEEAKVGVPSTSRSYASNAGCAASSSLARCSGSLMCGV